MDLPVVINPPALELITGARNHAPKRPSRPREDTKFSELVETVITAEPASLKGKELIRSPWMEEHLSRSAQAIAESSPPTTDSMPETPLGKRTRGPTAKATAAVAEQSTRETRGGEKGKAEAVAEAETTERKRTEDDDREAAYALLDLRYPIGWGPSNLDPDLNPLNITYMDEHETKVVAHSVGLTLPSETPTDQEREVAYILMNMANIHAITQKGADQEKASKMKLPDTRDRKGTSWMDRSGRSEADIGSRFAGSSRLGLDNKRTRAGRFTDDEVDVHSESEETVSSASDDPTNNWAV